MKNKLLIIGKILFIGLFCFVLLRAWNVKADNLTIEYSTNGYNNQNLWNSYISANVNLKPLYVYVDGNIVYADFYMNQSMDLMIEASKIADCFDCAASIYNEKEIVLQRKDITLRFNIDEQNVYYVNNEPREISNPFEYVEGELYVPACIIAYNFGFEYFWDVQINTMDFADRWNGDILPERYSLADSGRSTIVKNQGASSTCWAVASLSALETSLRPREQLIFSAEHMALKNSFTRKIDDGGEYTMSMAYLLSWQGPVLEEQDPYGDRKSPDNLLPAKHVQEIQIIKNKNIEKIKEFIFKNGAVQSSFYTSLKSSVSRSKYYNRDTKAYYFNGDEEPNHDIIIIGWDDNYPKENFSIQPENNGAYICQNSWGENFGDNGIFYISYEDSKIGSQSVGYSRVEQVSNYNNIYQTDLCGWVGQIGYGNEKAYFANVFTAIGKENVQAVGMYALDENTSYEIYKVAHYEDVNSLRSSELIASGTFENPGFYTVDLNQKFQVDEGQRFAIIIKIYSPNAIHPVAVEYAVEDRCENVDLSDGEGFISAYGEDWTNVESEYNCNVCMKLYTDTIE